MTSQENSGGEKPADPTRLSGIFEKELGALGVNRGSDLQAQRAAEQTAAAANNYMTGEAPSKPAPPEQSAPSTENTLPPEVLAALGFNMPPQRFSPEAAACKYLSLSLRLSELLSGKPANVQGLLAHWLAGDSPRYPNPLNRVQYFTGFVQHAGVEAINDRFAKMRHSEQEIARTDFIWQNRQAFVPLLSEQKPAMYTGGYDSDRSGLMIICRGSQDDIRGRHQDAGSGYGDYGSGSGQSKVLLTAFIVDPELRVQSPLAALAATGLRPWDALKPKPTSKYAYSKPLTFPLEDLITNTFTTLADTLAPQIRERVLDQWLSMSAVDKNAWASSPDSQAVIRKLPPELLEHFLGNVPAVALPINNSEFQAFMQPVSAYGTPRLKETMTQLLYGPEIGAAREIIETHNTQGMVIATALAERARNSEPAPGQTSDATLVIEPSASGHAKVSLSGAEGRRLGLNVTNTAEGEGALRNWQAAGFTSYEEVVDYINSLSEISVDVQLTKTIRDELLKTAFLKGAQALVNSFDGSGQFRTRQIPSEVGDYRVTMARVIGYRSAAEAILTEAKHPSLTIYWELARHLQTHGRLPDEPSVVALNVAMFDQQLLAVDPNEPYAIMDRFGKMTPDEILGAIRDIGEDVDIPDITLSTSLNDKQIMSQEGVYDALELMRQQGCDAVLGKTMAEAFSGTAAKVYVEQSLRALGYDMQEEPLETLFAWQSTLVAQAIQRGYTGDAVTMIEQFRPLTWAKEQEVITAVNIQDSPVPEWSFDQYAQARGLFEQFFDLAEQSGLMNYQRQNAPFSREELMWLSPTRGGGEIVISEQAKAHFAAKAVDWGVFLMALPAQAPDVPGFAQNYSAIRDLGDQLTNELADMSQGDIITRAKQIVHGEVAAVGQDIIEPLAVRTIDEYYHALSALLKTPKIHLVMTKRGRLGWSIGTNSPRKSRNDY